MSKIFCKLKELVEVKNGSTPSTTRSDFYDGNIVWITPKDLSNNKSRFVYSSERKITNAGFDSCSTSLLPIGSILLSSRAPIGLLAISAIESCTNQGFKNLVIKKDKIHNEYLYYWLKTKVKYIESLGTGTTFKEVSKGVIENLEIEIPEEIKDQQKIAAVLSSLDSKIELNNRINAELESMAKTLYDYWFVQFDFPDKNGKPYKTSGGKMVWNEELNREIPEGWEVGTIGNYCKSSGGYAFKSSWWAQSGLKVVKIKDIQEDNTINLSDLSCANVSGDEIGEKFLAKPGNILIAMTGATVGKFGIVPKTEEPLFVNQRVGIFNLGKDPTIKLPFLINSLNQSYFREAIFTLASGAAQPNISNEQINNIQLIFPKKTLMEEFNFKFYAFYNKLLSNRYQNQKLTELRDWLLPMLMNGQVKVN